MEHDKTQLPPCRSDRWRERYCFILAEVYRLLERLHPQLDQVEEAVL